MGYLQTAASILTSLLVGALTRFLSTARAPRTYLLLALSVLAVYWFQPLLPIRSLDFWLPSLTLGLVLLTWFIITNSGSWRSRENLSALGIILGVTALLALSRYVLPEPIFTAGPPPRFFLYFYFVVGIALIIL